MWFGTQTLRDAKRAGTRSLVNPYVIAAAAAAALAAAAAESRVQVNYLTRLRRPCKSGSKGLPDSIKRSSAQPCRPSFGQLRQPGRQFGQFSDVSTPGH